VTRRAPQETKDYPLFDVIGAGINGAGIARDAAMRGLRILLLDKGDVSGGTTQWATRRGSGGLRYLQYYEFHLRRALLRQKCAEPLDVQHAEDPLGT
jgi:glycerol-3-phosphate dehydrogenase